MQTWQGQHHTPDSFTQAFTASMPTSNVAKIHAALCHTGITQMLHFVRSSNLPYSPNELKKTCLPHRICAELKAQVYHTEPGVLITATQPMERLSFNFRAPCLLQFTTHTCYSYGRVLAFPFPFLWACSPQQLSSVWNRYLLFAVHKATNSDWGCSFLSKEIKSVYLIGKLHQAKPWKWPGQSIQWYHLEACMTHPQISKPTRWTLNIPHLLVIICRRGKWYICWTSLHTLLGYLWLMPAFQC